MSLIVYAPSGSGKSTFRTHAFYRNGVPVVDGDDTIAAHDAWPKAEDWWKDPAVKASVAVRHCEIIANLLRRNRDVAVVFNTKVAVMVPFLRDAVPAVRQAAVLLPLDEYMRRAIHRSQVSRTKGKEAAGGHRPRDPEDHLREWLRARDEYRSLRLRVFPSFEEAASNLGIFLSSRLAPVLSPPPALSPEWQARVSALGSAPPKRPPTR